MGRLARFPTFSALASVALAIVLALSLLLLSQGIGQAAKPSPGGDTTPPTLTTVLPANNTTGIVPTTNVEATFSEAMNASTINGSTFTLTSAGTTTPVAAQVSYDPAATKATLDPNADLAPGTTYTATIKGGAKGATDLAGNAIRSNNTWSFTTAAAPPAPDTTPPNTTIDSGPSATVSSTSASASFTFSSTEANSTFECSLDGGAFAPCSSPKTFDNLSDGSHTFQVKATDAAGNTDATPASRSWTVDTTAPETTIDSGPSGTINVADATFAFSSSEAGSTFECRLDGAAYSACASPKSFTGLANGSHTFDVRAMDGAGNVDATPASRTFTVDVPSPPQDTTPPDTTIDSGPSATVSSTSASASFTFSSTEANSTFECSLDGGAFAPCSSPKTFDNLSDGSHTFQVKATDAAGNTDATPASRSWTVDTTAPETTIDSG